MNKILVIPDVHGRNFWKAAQYFDGQIVFLGDYHDPYPFEFDPEGKYDAWYGDMKVRYNNKEGDFYQASYNNFKEIVEFKKQNPNRVTLLLGNHDGHYINTLFNCSRRDNSRRAEMKFILDNKELFQGCIQLGTTLFSHAGICKKWVDLHIDNNSDVCKETNEQILNMTESVLEPSRYRGGYARISGPLWLDVNEIPDCPLYIDDSIKFQIFGHTQQVFRGQIVPVAHGACIDSRAIFEVDPDDASETLKVWQPE